VATRQSDKRVRRTRKALAEALVGLTIEKGYEAVTIQEITGRAGVGYRTYFRHYADKDALLQDVLHSTVAELRGLIGPSPDSWSADARRLPRDAHRQPADGVGYQPLSEENGRIIFEHIAAQSDLYRVLLSSGSAALEPVMEYARREALNSLEHTPDLPVPPPILAQHIIATTFALVAWWLANGKPYTPDEMAVYLARLLAIPNAEFGIRNSE
jgi:AcrR family transcriptional regulator